MTAATPLGSHLQNARALHTVEFPQVEAAEQNQMNEILKPQSSQRIVLPSGREITVAKATPLFRKWARELPRDTFNGKPLLEFNSEMVFAELAILRSFQQAGWDGRWIDSFHQRYLTKYWPTAVSKPLPGQAAIDPG